MKRLAIPVVILLFLCSFYTIAYENYTNERFSFYIQYPAGFSKPSESTNGDGAVMTSADGKAEIRAYGSLVDPDVSANLSQEYKFETDKIHVTFHVLKGKTLIFSGVDSNTNQIVYQKTIIKSIDYFDTPNTPVFQTLRISYPSAQSEKYKTYCTLISKSLN